jgi:molybdopterin converting factor small subunit
MDLQIMILHIRFLSQTRKATGCDEMTIQTAGPIDVTRALDHLCGRFPDLCDLRSSLIVLRNSTPLRQNDTLNDRDEISLLPPMM